MSLEFGLAVINLLINMEVNVLTIGFNPKINKAVATLISGYRLFFWLKIRCFKGIKRLCFSTGRKNIYWYIEFTGVVGGGDLYFPPARKKIYLTSIRLWITLWINC
jgi:hypothetical protein